MQIERQPTDAEINAVLNALDFISNYINPTDGRIQGSGWREVHETLAKLSEYELWLGLCSIENAIFENGNHVTCIQGTLFELFQIAYEEGLAAL